MDKLEISWQRLVYDDETCPRCGGTEENLKKAVSKLKSSIQPLGLELVFNKKVLSVKEFKESPLESNMIFINDKPLEYWISGKVGKSECCDVCGPNDCRTITVDGETYEEIPSELIIKAGLMAVSEMIANKESRSCCDDKSSSPVNSSCC